jgi:hypothetical protein
MIFGTLFGISALLNVAFLGYRRFELSLATSAFIAFLYVIAALNAPMIF